MGDNMRKIKMQNKIMVIAIASLLLFIIIFAPFMVWVSNTAQSHNEQYVYFNQQRCVASLRARIQAQSEALTAEYDIYVPAIAPFSSGAYETRQGYLYTSDGHRGFSMAGLIVTADGDLVTIADNNRNSTDGSLSLYWNEETEEVLDGADRHLAIFLNSRLNRNELRLGGFYTRAIELFSTVYLVNYREPNGRYREIFVTIRTHNAAWWQVFQNTRHTVYDMNGRELRYERIGLPQPAPWWSSKWTTIRQNHRIRNVIDMWEDFLLGDLLQTIRLSTRHPWPQIMDAGRAVVTPVGEAIRVNPRTWQVTDFFGFPIINERTALPLIFADGNIIATNGQVQRIENAMLLDVMTVQDLLDRGVPFHQDFIYMQPFGYLDVPVRNWGTYYDPDWRLLNGELAAGITVGIADSRSRYSGGFWDGLRDLFGGDGGVVDIMRFIGIILGLILMLAVVVKILSLVLPLLAISKQGKK